MSIFKTFFKELRDFFSFFNLSKKEKEIVIYSEGASYLPNFEGIIDKIRDDKTHTLCYVTSDFNDPLLTQDTGGLKVFYINKLLIPFMQFLDSKIMIMTLVDLHKFHIKRSINPVKYVYVFHSIVSTHMMYREGAFDHYDVVLCVGPHQVMELIARETKSGEKPKQLVKSGYYRLERIYKDHKKFVSKDNKVVLIAPSWGDSNIMQTCGIELSKVLLNEGYKVVFRPHPEIIKRNQSLISEYINLFGNNNNFKLETEIESDQSLHEAAVLITDWSGIAFEYAFGTERPVLFIDLPRKIKNENYQDLGIDPIESSLRASLGKVIAVEEINGIAEYISLFEKNSSLYGEKLAQLREKYVYEFGKSSQVALDQIKEILKQEEAV